MKKRKIVYMTVKISCPIWLSAQDARREVRTLINYQSFYGAYRISSVGFDEVSSDNFRALGVAPAKGPKK